MLNPVRDGGLMALLGLARGLLATPAHLAQPAPDMAGVVAHTADPQDHLGDAGQGPRFGGKAMREC